MKKHLLFICLLLTGTISAQVYQPFPSSGITWREDMDGLGFNCCCSAPQSVCLLEDKYEHFLQGDTTIGSYVYHKIYRHGYYDEYLFSQTPYTCQAGCENFSPEYYGSRYLGGLREDITAHKVYFHSAQAGSQDTVLYDFNLSVGDYLDDSYNNEAGTNWVSKIDSVLVGNTYHKRYWLNYMDETQHQEYAAIIEGIGSTYGLFHKLVPPFEFRNQLICVKIDANPVYPDTNSACSLSAVNKVEPDLVFSLAPNPVENTSALYVNADFEGSDLVIFTETGKEIGRKKIVDQSAEIHKKDFSPGIYFFKIMNETGRSGTGKFVVGN